MSPESVAHKEVVEKHHQYPVPKDVARDPPHHQYLAPRAGTEGEPSDQHPVPRARGHRPRIPPPLAESERYETGAEFAARMKDKFVLRSPREQTEGGMGTSMQPPSTSMPTSQLHSLAQIEAVLSITLS